jgi:hypothetical protein
MGDRATLEQQVSALDSERNARRAAIARQLANRQDCIRLEKLYPVGV